MQLSEEPHCHALACPSENTLYLAQEFSYRFDKIELTPVASSARH